MLREFWVSLRVQVGEKYKEEFRKILLRENVERIFLISLLAVFFFFLLFFLDVQRIITGKFNEHFIYQISAFLHFCLAFFIVPAFIIQHNSQKITEGVYEYSKHLVYGSVLWLAVVLVPMALFATIDRKSLMTFVIFLIVTNLFLTLPKKIMNALNFFSLLVLMIGVYFIQKINQWVLYEALIEAVGISVPIILINRYQYYQRAKRFINERMLEEQNSVIQKNLEKGFNQRLVEIEMRALRAQMNPHFLFNVLNSIKLYMVQNDAKTASKYLTKFSRLIRLVLNNSKSSTVNLKDDLEALQLYIEMENFRFNNKFDFEIKVDNNVDTEFLEIPPLILQPYVENAIWHGLMHKDNGRGKLNIEISLKDEDNILFLIEDNGIGRERAEQLKTNTARKRQHKSVGMEITRDRIQATNQFFGTNASVEIIDLKDENDEALGTKVLILLPIT